MNYYRHYCALIQKRKVQLLTKDCEKHHIQPKSICPEKQYCKENIVNLSYKQHFVAHHLLYRHYKSIGDAQKTKKMALAWHRMCKNRDGIHVTMIQFERAKRALSEVNKNNKTWLGRKHTQETKKKLSQSKRGAKNPMYGKHLSQEAKKKLSQAKSGQKHHQFGKPRPLQVRLKISKALKGPNNPRFGKPRDPQTRKKISEARKGFIPSKETREKWSKLRKSRKPANCKKVLCCQTNKIYNSCKQAGRQTGIASSNISWVCLGKHKTTGNFHWRYL